MRLHTIVEVVGLEIAIIGGGAGDEPVVRRGGGKQPAGPEGGGRWVVGGRFVVVGCGFGRHLHWGGFRSQQTVARGEEAVVLCVTLPATLVRDPGSLVGPSDCRPDHKARGHVRTCNLRVHGAAVHERRGMERLKRELLVDVAPIFLVQLLPLQVARHGHVRHVFRVALRIGLVLQANVQILGVVVAPIEAFRTAEPFVLRAAP